VHRLTCTCKEKVEVPKFVQHSIGAEIAAEQGKRVGIADDKSSSQLVKRLIFIKWRLCRVQKIAAMRRACEDDVSRMIGQPSTGAALDIDRNELNAAAFILPRKSELVGSEPKTPTEIVDAWAGRISPIAVSPGIETRDDAGPRRGFERSETAGDQRQLDPVAG
jgi:hypothetical protein